MAGLINNLIDVLEGQVELYGQMIALSAQKKECIIKNDIEALRKVVGEENAVVPRLIRHDKERESVLNNICVVLNKKQDELTLSRLVVLMEEQPEYEKLKSVVDRVKDAVSELKALNESNKVLIENALEFIDYNINLIHSTFSPAPAGYGDNLTGAEEQRSFLDINT